MAMALEVDREGRPIIRSDERGEYAICLGWVRDDARLRHLPPEDQQRWAEEVRCGERHYVGAAAADRDSVCARCQAAAAGPWAGEQRPCPQAGCPAILLGGAWGNTLAWSWRGSLHECRYGHLSVVRL
jgi:hypothetical protein